MQTVEIKKGLQIRFDDLIQSVAKFNTAELTTFFEQLNLVIGGQQPPSPIVKEALLLKQIKAMIPASVVRRYKELQAKQHNYTISEKEREEILMITDFIEEKSAERIALLAALAEIRQVSLPELVKQIKLKDYHA